MNDSREKLNRNLLDIFVDPERILIYGHPVGYYCHMKKIERRLKKKKNRRSLIKKNRCSSHDNGTSIERSEATRDAAVAILKMRLQTCR